MIMQERWTQWKPTEKIRHRYSINTIRNTLTDFAITLQQSNIDDTLKIYFSIPIISYRVCDETYRTNLIESLAQCYTTEFYSTWSFFKIENSAYIQWLLQRQNKKNEHLFHFCIIDDLLLVDVIAQKEPHCFIE